MLWLGVLWRILWWFERCAAMKNTGISARLGKSYSGARKKAASGLLFGWLPSKSLVDEHSASAWRLMRGNNGQGETVALTTIGGSK